MNIETGFAIALAAVIIGFLLKAVKDKKSKKASRRSPSSSEERGKSSRKKSSKSDKKKDDKHWNQFVKKQRNQFDSRRPFY